MKNLFHVLLLAALASSPVAFTACSSKSDPAPQQAQTGTLSGQITPATSITTVTATSSTNQTVTATPTAAGAYSFANLAAGTYTLSFTPAAGYTAPAPQTVTVSAGGNTTATPVTVISSGGSGSISVGGVTTTPPLILANFISNNLSITLASVTGTSVVLNMDGFANAVATFQLANPSNSTQLIYSQTIGTVTQQWTTAGFLSNNMGSGTIVVTAVGANPRRVSGTFNATAYPATSASTGTKAITGSFSNVPY